MHCNNELFSRQYPAVVCFAQHLAYCRGVKAAWSGITDHQEFWASTVDGHLKLATVAWCKVFGSCKEAHSLGEDADRQRPETGQR